ncbi:winged helix-turn-helix transcriptional regulator [Acidobacteriota bacterium]
MSSYNQCMSNGDAKQLIKLLHHRWAVPVLAELRRSQGAKFITLVNRLNVSRDSLRHTLSALIENAWVVRNPGYGHPLRPEYLLSPAGEKLAPWCHRIMVVLTRLGIEDIALRKWSLPVILALREGLERFSEVKKFLPGMTPRSLTLTLKQLEQSGLVNRFVSDGYPPSSHYRLTARGRKISAILVGLPV